LRCEKFLPLNTATEMKARVGIFNRAEFRR
jgi:hypothetical protein